MALVALLAVTGAYAGRGASMRNLQGVGATGENTSEDLEAKYHDQVQLQPTATVHPALPAGRRPYPVGKCCFGSHAGSSFSTSRRAM